MRRGFDFNLLDPICLPQTPGYDIVGHVCACGSKVDPAFEDGDRVAAIIRTGGNARFVSVPASSLVKIPRNIDSAEAVAMVSTFTTAYQTLKRITQKGPMFSLLGKRVLVLGGMDGVGQALIQMCMKARADIYAPCPRSCHPYMQNVLGAHPLPDDKDQWLSLVESQMDYVFDGVCEDGLESSQKALTAEGELVCYGHTAMLKEKEMGIFGAPLSAHVSLKILISVRYSSKKTCSCAKLFFFIRFGYMTAARTR
jgi:NADPH:quinone reductase-like Zn-dependent oxidoreductase